MISKAALSLAMVALLVAGQASAQVRDIPKARWEPIYFRSINEFTSRAGWKPLRDQSLGSDAMEVRVWIGFGIGPLQGLSMRRDGSNWRASYASQRMWQPGSITARGVTPKSDWAELWPRLVQLGLLTLPDESMLPKSGAGQAAQMADGVSYVVEINTGGRYRTYMYGNPEHADWPEARRMIEIMKALQAELIPKS